MIRMTFCELKCIMLLTLTTTFVGVDMVKMERDAQKALKYLALASELLDKTGISSEIINIFKTGEDDSDEKLDEILTEIKDLSGKLDNVENHLTNQMNNMRRILTKTLRQSHDLDDTLRDLSGLINSVHLIYKNYLDIVHPIGNRKPPDQDILEFVQKVVSTGPGNLRNILKQISVLISSPTQLNSFISKDFLTLFADDTASSVNEACGATFSAQQQIYEIYLMLMLTEKESLDVIEYASTQLQRLTNASHDWHLITAYDETNERLKTYYHYLSEAMQKAPRDIRPCDPKKHERKETFIEFERLFGLYVTNQHDNVFHRDHTKCLNTCEFNNWHLYNYNSENFEETTEMSSAFPSRSDLNYSFKDYCYGTLSKCWTLGDVEYCRTPGSLRRFEWIKDKNGHTYGNDKAGCSNGVQYKYNHQKWLDWNSYAYCDYCICQCTLVPGAPGGIILISLMEEVADIDNNKVVTGIRFVLNGGIVMLQIKEGVLFKRGRVMKSQWKPIMNITNQRNVIIKQLQNDGSYIQLESREHYEALSKNSKTIFLDDIVVPYQYVVTGVRINFQEEFTKDENFLLFEKSFYLEVLATPFDYSTGKLNTSNEYTSLWFSDELMKMMKSPEYLRARSGVVLNSPENPLKNEINIVDSKPNQFVELRYSDPKLDAGQTVVPFVDIQPVEATPDVPLSGVGIFHKGAPGSGGYIAPRIFTYDFSAHIKQRAFKAQNHNP